MPIIILNQFNFPGWCTESWPHKIPPLYWVMPLYQLPSLLMDWSSGEIRNNVVMLFCDHIVSIDDFKILATSHSDFHVSYSLFVTSCALLSSSHGDQLTRWTYFKGNPNFQGILNWILQILHYYCRKQQKKLKTHWLLNKILFSFCPFLCLLRLVIPVAFLNGRIFSFLRHSTPQIFNVTNDRSCCII